MNDNVALPSEFAQSPKFDRQVVPLAANFAGLNRMVSPQNLPESQSPDTTDARSSNLRMGALGPRNGRKKIFSRTTDTNSLNRSYLPFTGMGVLNSSYGKYRVLSDAGGSWVTTVIPWPGLNAVSTPSTLTGRANVRTRFTQYKNRLYAHNGRDRMRDLDGKDWQFAGITRPLFTPAGFANDGSGSSDPVSFAIKALTVVAASISAGVATLTTGTAHGYSVGDAVTVTLGDPAYNGTFILTAVPTTTTMTYAVGSSTPVSDREDITNVVRTNTQKGVITAPVLPLSQGAFAVGDLVKIETVTPAPGAFAGGFSFDATLPISAISGNDITVYYPYTGSGDVSVVPCIGGVTRVGKPSPVPFWTKEWSVQSNVFGGVTATPHGLVVGQIIGARGATSSAGVIYPDIPGVVAGSMVITSVPTPTEFTFAYTYTDTSVINAADAQLNFWKYPLGTVYKNLAGGGGSGANGASSGAYRYYVTACNSKHGDAWGRPIESIPSLISNEVTLSNQAFTINNIPSTHPDPQVDSWNIYRNKAGEYSTDLESDQQDFWLVGSVALGTTTFTDTAPDFKLTGADRLRFDQNIPPAFKYGAIYGDRMFGAGFDPITSGTASASSATITVSGVTLPDGVLGCWFKADGDNAQYVIIARPTSTTITLDRNYSGTLSGGKFAIYRNPWEIYFSEFQDVEAWGPDGEQRRFKLEVPGHQAVTGLMEWNGSLLVFTANSIYAIDGKGPNRTDIRLLPAPIYSGLGALSGDAICRVDNDVYFLSSRGPCAMASGTPQLLGINLNYDYIDALTQAETSLAVAGTDGRDVYFSLPSATGQTMNSKTFRFEVYTKSWWEETGMCPTLFVRADSDNGQKDVLFYLQGEFVWQPNSGTIDGPQVFGYDFIDLLTDPVQFTQAVHSGAGVIAQFIIAATGSPFPTALLGLCETVVRFYQNNVLVAIRRIIPQWDDAYGGHTLTNGSQFTWSLDSTLPYSGKVTVDFNRIEIGNIPWRWVSRTLEVNGKLTLEERCFATFDAKGATSCYKTNIIDGVQALNAEKINATQKTASWAVRAAHFDYAVLLTSRDGAVIRNVVTELEAEASNK